MDTVTKRILLTPLNILYRIAPRLELKLLFRLKQGYKLNLKNPKTFNEKLQWIKLYDRNPLMPKCVDKYTVREYVESVGCGEILNELIWEGFNPEDIPFDKLPKKFVIKVTHGSTFNIICTDKNKLDCEDTIKKCKKWLKEKFIPCYGEWFYGIEKPRIVIEKYLEDKSRKGDLMDYKIFCFNGEPKIVDVHCGRFSGHRRNIYDLDWNMQEDVYFKYEHFNGIERPKELDKALEYAKKLSANFNHVRVDFFIVNGKLFFGELTFTNGAGLDTIKPYEFDLKMGSWLKLPTNKKGAKNENR